MQLNSLPHELLSIIFSFITPISSLLELETVCRQWQLHLRNVDLWRQLMIKKTYTLERKREKSVVQPEFLRFMPTWNLLATQPLQLPRAYFSEPPTATCTWREEYLLYKKLTTSTLECLYPSSALFDESQPISFLIQFVQPALSRVKITAPGSSIKRDIKLASRTDLKTTYIITAELVFLHETFMVLDCGLFFTHECLGGGTTDSTLLPEDEKEFMKVILSLPLGSWVQAEVTIHLAVHRTVPPPSVFIPWVRLNQSLKEPKVEKDGEQVVVGQYGIVSCRPNKFGRGLLHVTFRRGFIRDLRIAQEWLERRRLAILSKHGLSAALGDTGLTPFASSELKQEITISPQATPAPFATVGCLSTLFGRLAGILLTDSKTFHRVVNLEDEDEAEDGDEDESEGIWDKITASLLDPHHISLYGVLLRQIYLDRSDASGVASLFTAALSWEEVIDRLHDRQSLSALLQDLAEVPGFN